MSGLFEKYCPAKCRYQKSSGTSSGIFEQEPAGVDSQEWIPMTGIRVLCLENHPEYMGAFRILGRLERPQENFEDLDALGARTEEL